MADSQDLVLVERRAGVLWLTLNRADKANAMTVAMVERVKSEMVAAGNDADVKAIVLTAAGERVFCAGVDVREQPADGDMARQRERRSIGLAALQDVVMDTPKPVIVALNGTASGAGGMLALMADACVAVDSASLSLPEIDIGIATFSGASILEAIGGRALALDLIQTGRKMPAQEGQARGLIHAIASRQEFEGLVTKTAELLGSKKADTFADNKRWINRGLKASLAEARDEHSRHRARTAH